MNFRLNAFTTVVGLVLSTPAHADCLAEIQGIMQNYIKAGPYHAAMESDIGGPKRTTEIDAILPSSFHMKAPDVEVIILKEGVWMNTGGKWMTMPVAMSGMVEQNIKMSIASMKDLSNVQCEGAQSIESQTLNKYEMDSSGRAMGINLVTHVTMYASDKGLPQIMVVDGEEMGHKNHTVLHITYDPSITITPPNLK
ncbi:MAG: hypothetical protein M3O03_01625 [Pseudomonadota bacterium]|nr:hypothetical protein [Pseudomonadota bacterium]